MHIGAAPRPFVARPIIAVLCLCLARPCVAMPPRRPAVRGRTLPLLIFSIRLSALARRCIAYASHREARPQQRSADHSPSAAEPCRSAAEPCRSRPSRCISLPFSSAARPCHAFLSRCHALPSPSSQFYASAVLCFETPLQRSASQFPRFSMLCIAVAELSQAQPSRFRRRRRAPPRQSGLSRNFSTGRCRKTRRSPAIRGRAPRGRRTT